MILEGLRLYRALNGVLPFQIDASDVRVRLERATSLIGWRDYITKV